MALTKIFGEDSQVINVSSSLQLYVFIVWKHGGARTDGVDHTKS